MSEWQIEMTNVMNYCEMMNFAKQLAIRTSSWGGVIEMIMTAAMAPIRNLVEPGGSDLYNAFLLGFVESNSCARTARAWGRILYHLFAFEVRNDLFVDDLTFKLE